MDRIDENIATLIDEIIVSYNDADGYKDTGYYLADHARQVYSIIIVPDDDHPLLKIPRIMLFVRVIEEIIIIDVDTTDKPLYQELLRAGIPREQMILRYAGETLPESLRQKLESE